MQKIKLTLLAVCGLAIATFALTQPTFLWARMAGKPVVAQSLMRYFGKDGGSPFIDEMTEKLTAYFDTEQPEKLYVQLDKTLVSPGDDVWFKTYVRSATSLKAAQQSEVVYVELLSPKGSVEKKLTLVMTDGGAAGEFKIPTTAAGGIWKIKIHTDWGKNDEQVLEREITVQRVVLPHLNMKLEFARKAYGAGDRVEAKIDLNTLENKPLANTAFSFKSSLKGAEHRSGSGTTDANGHAVVQFELPSDLATNDGLLNIVIQYQGQAESISRSVPIVLNKIDLQLLPEGGDMLANVPNRVAFKAINEFGKPADVRGEVLDSKGKVVANFDSYHAGMGAYTFTPKADEAYTARITSPAGIAESYRLPYAMERGYALSCDTKNDEIAVSINSTEAEPLTLVVQQRGKLAYAKVLEATRGAQTVHISTVDLPIGVASVTLFDSKRIARAERLVFCNPTKQLNIAIKTDKTQYRPREKVKMTVNITDERGVPMPGNFSLAVVDDKLLTFADDKQANILAEVLLQADLKGDIDEANFYFDKKEPKATQALDFLMLTQGWRKFNWDNVLDKKLPTKTHKGEKALIAGKVLASAGAPMAGVSVSIKGKKETATRTDNNGHFAIKGVVLTKVETLVFDNGKDFVQYEQPISEYNADLTITAKVCLKGRVFDERTKEPIPFGTVYIMRNGAYFMGANTDVDGKYMIENVPAGSYTVTAQYVGYDATNVNNVAINNTTKLDIVLKQGAQLLDEVVVTSNHDNRRHKLERGKAIPQTAVAEKKIAVGKASATVPAIALAPPMPSPPSAAQAENTGVSFKQPMVQNDVQGGKSAPKKGKKEIKPHPKGEEAAKAAKDVPEKAPQAAAIVAEPVIAGIVLPNAFDGEADIAVDDVQDEMQGNDGAVVNQRGRADLKQVVIQKKLAGGVASVRYANAAIREFYAPQYTIREKVKARTDFRKTLYWNPNVTVGRNGRADIEFYCNDDVSQFRTTVEGFATDGGIGRAEQLFFTQLPLQMTCKIPTQVLTGDRMSIPLTLTNNGDEAITGKYEANAPKAFLPQNTLGSNATTQAVTLAAHESKTFYLTYLVADTLGNCALDVYFYNHDGSDDHVAETVRINPRGFPVHDVFSGNEQTKTYDVNVVNPISGSISCRVVAHPSTIGEVMRGLESMLHTPGGCFEQTSSTNYPNVLVLNYLRETKESKPELEATTKGYLDAGYKILTGYESKSGGFDWWGRDPAHEALTAYGLMEFMDMTKVYAVDQKIIDRTKKWLLARRDGSGSWKASPPPAHTWVASGEVRDAYIAWALCEAGLSSELQPEINKMYKDAVATKDPYVMALAANSLTLAKDKRAAEILADLVKLQNADGSWNGKTNSVVASTGHGLIVETTSLAVLAILKSKIGTAALPKAVDFLAKAKTSFGYGNTQATVLALKAILAHTEYSKRTEDSGDLVVYIDGARAASVHYKADEKEDIVVKGLERYLRGGEHKIQVKFENTKSPMPYEIELNYTTSLPIAQTGCKVDMTTALAATQCKMGETVRLTTTLQNKTSEILPSTMAVIGIPAGLSPQIWQLKELRDKQIADYYEIFDGYVVLHYAGMAANEKREINLDLKADIPGEYEAPASSAFLYYTNEFKDWEKPAKIRIF